MTINDLGIVETYTQNDLNNDYRHYGCRNRTTGEYIRYAHSPYWNIYTTPNASEVFVVGFNLREALRFLFRNELQTEWGIVAL